MIKIKRKSHNQMFRYRQLKFYQYSIVSDIGELECYYSKWFLTLVFIPTLLIGGFTDGFIRTFKSLIDCYKNPYTSDYLTQQEFKKLTRGVK